MPVQDRQQHLTWDTVHASAYGHVRGLLRPAAAVSLKGGALRYRCPLTGSFVLVTDKNTLHWLARPRAQLRCADCGELHLLTFEAEDAVVAATSGHRT
jgi:hypothetical protein